MPAGLGGESAIASAGFRWYAASQAVSIIGMMMTCLAALLGTRWALVGPGAAIPASGTVMLAASTSGRFLSPGHMEAL